MKNKVAVSLAGVHTHTHTHTLCLLNNGKLSKKAKKQEKVNKKEKYKQEKNLLKKIGFSSCFFEFKTKNINFKILKEEEKCQDF